MWFPFVTFVATDSAAITTYAAIFRLRCVSGALGAVLASQTSMTRLRGPRTSEIT